MEEVIRKLLAPLTLVAQLLYPTQARIIDKASESVVHITMVKPITFFGEPIGEFPSSCSGIVVAKDRILSANHCNGKLMHVDHVKIEKVQKWDEYNDLLLINGRTTKPPLAWRDSPIHRFDKVYAIGFAFGYNRIFVLETKMVLVGYSPSHEWGAPGDWTQGGYIGGMSGGPVIDTDGRMVGIVQDTVGGEGSQSAGFGVGMAIIRAFLVGTDVVEN